MFGFSAWTNWSKHFFVTALIQNAGFSLWIGLWLMPIYLFFFYSKHRESYCCDRETGKILCVFSIPRKLSSRRSFSIFETRKTEKPTNPTKPGITNDVRTKVICFPRGGWSAYLLLLGAAGMSIPTDGKRTPRIARCQFCHELQVSISKILPRSHCWLGCLPAAVCFCLLEKLIFQPKLHVESFSQFTR